MVEIKISVVIPVYNVEKYLKKCLDSVINQTLREIEIICVNDGSTDKSLQILEEYAEKDDRIRIITKENGGIASARNRGMKYVNGNYVGFVDSDDWIKPDMYEKLYENARLYDSDMVMCAAHRFDDVTQELECDLPYFTLEHFDETFDNCVFTHETKDFLFALNVTPWNKLYKTEFLKETGIKFPEGMNFEDNVFFYETYLKASRVSLVRDFLYYYRINRADSFITSANEGFFDIVAMFDLTEDILMKTSNHDKYVKQFSNIRISSTLRRYDQVDEKYKKDFFEVIKENFKKMNMMCINNLNARNTKEYQKILNSSTYKEYELMKRIDYLTEVHEEKEKQWQNEFNSQKEHYESTLKDQQQAYETEINTQRKMYEGEIAAKEQVIHELGAQRQAFESEVMVKEGVIRELEVQRQAFEDEVMVKEGVIRELEVQRQAFESEVMVKEGVIRELEVQRQAYENEINAKNQLIQELTSSNSWKLTKPLRKIGTMVRKGNS